MSYQLPFHSTLGISFLLTDGSGRIVSPTLAIPEVPEDGLEALIARLLAQFAERGLTPLSPAQYAQFGIGLAAQEQERRLVEAQQAHIKGRALSDAECDAILRAHKGEPQ